MTHALRVIALGGAGAMGRVAVKTLLQKEMIGSLVIADKNLDAAYAFAKVLADPRIEVKKADVTDGAGLRSLLSQADVVISTIGPYYRFGTTVLQAAIDTKTHYVDICDDWQPTIAMLDLDEAAKEAGITAIVGAGASPGISNLLAVKAATLFDEVDTLHTVWGTGGRSSDNDDIVENSAALHHWLAMLTGKIKIYRGREWIDARPFERIPIDYPGIGRVFVHTVGHPEPISLPRSYPLLKNSVNAMDMHAGVIAVLKEATGRIEREDMSFDDAVQYVGKVFARSDAIGLGMAIRETVRYSWHSSVEAVSRKKYLPPLAAYATGIKDGKPLRVGVSMRGRVPGGMAAITCIPTAVMTEMLAEGEITRLGVFAPEKGVDPDGFFKRLAPFTTRPDVLDPPVDIATAA